MDSPSWLLHAFERGLKMEDGLPTGGGWDLEIGTEISACKKATSSPLHATHFDSSGASECLSCDALMDVHYQSFLATTSLFLSQPWLENGYSSGKASVMPEALTKDFPRKRTL